MGWLRKPAESLGVTGGGVQRPSPGGSAAEVSWDGHDLENQFTVPIEGYIGKPSALGEPI